MAKQKDTRFRRVRTPTVLQMESTECGAAALGIILGYYGRHVPLEELRAECRVSRDGTNALYIKKTAEKYGLISHGYQMSVDDLRTLKPPFVVFWELNHFLVVEGFRGRLINLSDPASGRRTIDEASFRASYTGIVFRFEPGPGFVKGGARPSTWKAILGRMAGASAAVLYIVLAGVALMISELVAATYNLIFVDQILVEQRSHWIRPLLFTMGFTAAFRALIGILQLDSLRQLKLSLSMAHSAKFLWHVLRLPVAFYQQRFAGEISARVESNSLVADLISGQLATTIVGLLMVVFYAALMFAFDKTLTALGVFIGSLNLVAVSIVSRILTDENLKIKQVRGKLYGSMMRSIQMIETIKASAAEAETLVRLTGLQVRMTNSSQIVGAVSAVLIALPPFLLFLTTAALLWIGGGRVIDGMMSVGALLAFQTLMFHFNRPFGDLVRLGSSVQSLEAELARLDDVYQYAQDPVFDNHCAKSPDTLASSLEASRSRREPPRRLSGHLALKDATFGYNSTADEPLIKGFSLEIQPGSRVALVGASGSGKSTIGRLVAGLYQPWSGAILYDGFQLDEIPRGVFTSQVAIVDDQTFLFSGSVRENLTLWDETIPEREMIRSAIDAGIHRDLIKRRGGYHAPLAEGARNFSGGQRQRLEIARALIRNPALLVLDEATSALDPMTEAFVDDNLRRRGCTCLIIAHRLSTIRDCDEIIVLNQGRVVQRGTHEQLMSESDGFYHELQTLQDGIEANLVAPSNGAAPDQDRSIFPVSSFDESHRLVSPPVPSSNGHGMTYSEDFDRPNVPTSNAVRLEVQRLMVELEPYGETVTTAGNHPLPLDDTGSVWRVLSGQVDVFYVQPEPGQTRGSRRHLCRVEDGGSIFAIDGVRSGELGHLLAIGVGTARLRKFPKADLLRLSLEPEWRSAVADLIDDWIDRISRSAGPDNTPPNMIRLESDHTLRVDSGQMISTKKQVLWIRNKSEGMRFFGAVMIPPCPLDSRFPLSSHAWLSLGTENDISAWSTQTLMEDGDPWVGLKRFHQVILDAIAVARARDRAVRHARLESSGLRDDAMVSGAIDELAQLVRPVEAIPVSKRGHELFLEVCRQVAAPLHIEVKAPPYDAEGDPLQLIAKASSFRTRRVRLQDGWWKTDCGSMLGFIATGNCPVAIIPATSTSYTLIDCSQGSRTAITEDVARTLSNFAVTFYRTLDGTQLKAGDLSKFCLPLVKGDLKILLAMGLLSGILGLAAPTLTSIAIDDAIPRAELGQLGLLCAFLISLGFAIAWFQIIQGLALVRMKGRLEASLLPAVWDRLLTLPTRFFAGHEAGDLALRAMGIARVIEVAASTSVASLLIGSFSLLNIFILFYFNWKLALVGIVLGTIGPLATLVILPTLWRYQRMIARSQGRISALLLILLGGIARLRVAGAEKRAFARWAGRYKKQLELMIGFQRLSDKLTVFNDVWPLVIIMVVFGALVALGPEAMTTGDFLAFNLALAQGLAAVIGLGKNLLPLLNGLEQFERFRPILEVAPETADVSGEAVILGGSIRLTNVSYRYDADGPLVLDSVNLHVRPGEFVAIVGPSGSGKSTLLRLLLGFEVPTEGVIAYDGRELFTLDIQDVRRQIGVVLQDAQLFPGDIYTNIVGLGSHYTISDAKHAAALAGLSEEIEHMPMGIHTVIGEGGGGLSSGQRQRLIIARALVRNPKIVLLDEATSALDNRSQAFVNESIQGKLQGTSRVSIAHRVSTIINADRIYVLSEGRIVQCGRYTQLINETGPFQDLARRQVLA